MTFKKFLKEYGYLVITLFIIIFIMSYLLHRDLIEWKDIIICLLLSISWIPIGLFCEYLEKRISKKKNLIKQKDEQI